MSRENIYDSTGKLLYWVEKQGDRLLVQKADGTVLGWCWEGNTYDSTGNLVCYGISPGSLYRG